MCPSLPGGPDGPPGAFPPLIALRGVTKRFGPIVANRDVSFAVNGGEVLALVGENGAGKSTVVNLLSGLYRPDAGTIALGGEILSFASPADAVGRGIGVVHQHYTLIPALTVLDNIALAMPELGGGRIDRKALAVRVDELAADLGFELRLAARTDTLDVANQQRVEIVKALIRKVRVLLLDEPTAVLGPRDKERLFAMVRRLKSHGVAVLLVTHKLEDIDAVADRVVVLRAGAVVADEPAATLSHAAIVELMIGSRDPTLAAELERPVGDIEVASAAGDEVGRLVEVTLRRPNGSLAVEGLNAALRASEILAVAGVDGNGQAELVRCLAGVDSPASGSVEVLGLQPSGSHRLTADRVRQAGLAHIPDDRRHNAIIERLDLADNFLLGNTHDARFWRRGMVRYRPLVDEVKRWIAAFDIRTTGPRQRMAALSGGNQQKFVVARELAHQPRLLIAAHPSRGLDIRTVHFVHEQLRRERERGAAILLVSGDLDEVLSLADRILVLAAGRAFGPFDRGAVSLSEIGAFMAGRTPATGAAA